ncbi:MAG: hypothetical protein FAF03_02775 [Epsilonproteobacteria bacterium]|nr:hypothetical protein [Campylobacterota bacterium]
MTTAGATLTQLAGVGHLNVTPDSFYRTVGDVVSNTSEADADPSLGAAAGSVQVNGTYTTLTFDVTAAVGSTEGLGGDGLELAWELQAADTPPEIQLQQTVSVAITNPSFEADVLADGDVTMDTISGWTTTASTGVWNIDSPAYSDPSVIDGENVAYIDASTAGATISQVLTETFEADRSYTLTAMVGDESLAEDASGWEMRLYGGSQLLGSVSNADFDPANDSFVEATLNLDASTLATYSANYGDALTIEFYNIGDPASVANVDFDDVQLAYTPVEHTDEDTALVFNTANGNLISISDADVGVGLLETSLSVNDGILNLSGTTGLTFVSGSNVSSTMTFTGTLADISTALDGLSFTPDADFNGSVSLHIETHDDTNLIGAYTFDNLTNLGEDSGAGISYDGTVVGATQVNDVTRGDVLSFDDTTLSDGVEINGLYGEPTDVTLSAWINFTGAEVGEVISLGDSVILRAGDWDTSDGLQGIFYQGNINGDDTDWITLQSNTAISGTGWHHVAYTFDDTNNEQTLYLDGVVVANATVTNSISYTAPAIAGGTLTNSTIGRHADSDETQFFFDGMIDDARVYDSALTAAEIAEIMDASLGVDTDTVTITVDAVNDAPTFGVGDGIVTTDIGSSEDSAYALVLQDDGKVLVSGYSFNGTSNEVAITRYNTDGSLDTSFGTNGIVTTDITVNNDIAYDITLQTDGKFFVSGFSSNGTSDEFLLMRYNSDGTLDSSFDSDGIVTTDITAGNDESYSIALQSDGKILLAGYSFNGTNTDFALIRYNSDGSLDSSFDSDGIVNTDISANSDVALSLSLQVDDKILVTGYASNGTDWDIALLRYNTDGTLDTDFNGSGIVTTDFGIGDDIGQTVLVQPDGKILVSGTSFNGVDNDFALLRYNTDGSLDTTFSGDGKLTTNIGNNDTAYSAVLQDDGKLYL